MSEASKIPAVEIAVRTDPGRDPDKQVNEDASVHKETHHGLLAVVCDGMGGHAGGKEASELAIKTILEIVEAAPAATSAVAALKRAIEEANARIWSMPTAEAGYRPGSTVVAVLAHETGAEIAHVGDSRLYLVHAGAISQVTRDHSMVQEMVDRNLIRAEDAAQHPDANKILRALGIAKEVDVEVRSASFWYVTGAILVLCSDGLSDLVEPAEILQIAGSHPPMQAAGQLVDLANARGGHDNITAMVIRMKASATTVDAPTVLKTMSITAHMTPADRASGPTGTVVSPPIGAAHAVAAPAAPPAPSPIGTSGPSVAASPPKHPDHSGPVSVVSSDAASTSRLPRTEPGRGRTPMLALGIALALLAVAIVSAVVYIAMRPEHHAVKVVDDRPRDAGLPDDDDGGQDPSVAPAPTLSVSAEPSAKHYLWRRADGGVGDPCAGVRRAREHDASAAVIGRLEERCRAHGGTL